MTVEDGKTTDDFFPSRFMKAADVDEEKPVLTVMDVNYEPIGEDNEMKLILAFQEVTKELVLNRTNASNLEEMYGKVPNNWIGKRVEMYTTFVDFKGKSVEAVRIKPQIPTESPLVSEPVQEPIS